MKNQLQSSRAIEYSQNADALVSAFFASGIFCTKNIELLLDVAYIRRGQCPVETFHAIGKKAAAHASGRVFQDAPHVTEAI